MGRKRSWQRQHVYLSIACLILAISACCAPATHPVPYQVLAPPACEECGHLHGVGGLLDEGNFEAAMKESQDVLAGSPKSPPGDEALMDMGLISAHYANPKKDYKKALSYFMRIEKEFPGSPLVQEAKIWIGVLQAFEKAKQVDLEVEKMKKGLGK